MSHSRLRTSIKNTARKYGAKKIRLFGSYARNEQTASSDIDLLVEMPKGSSILDLAGLKQDLEQKLGNKVDIVTYTSIKPSLRKRILQEAKTL